MSATDHPNATGVGFGSLLFLLFLALKLTHQIAWSWWWVTAPLWAIPAIAIGILGGAAMFVAGATLAQFVTGLFGRRAP